MVAGYLFTGSYSLADGKRPREHSRDENLDRFIPNRAAMDFDFANYMLTGRKVEKDSGSPCSPSREAYKKVLAEIFNMNRTRILAFRNKPPPSINSFEERFSPFPKLKPAKRPRRIPQSCERILDTPDLMDDYYLNLLDWGVGNIIAIGLGNTVYLWNADGGLTSELLSADDDTGPVTSLKWATNGRHIAVGFNNSEIQLWDSSCNKLVRTLREVHRLRVGSLDWNSNILTSGSMDSSIVNNDVRIVSPNIGTYRGHNQEVCGLKWSISGQHLASGGNDNLVHIWNLSSSQSLHRFSGHASAVKALSWCPFQSNLLASGGGLADQCIRFWNCNTGACLNSVNTGSQVSCLLWSNHERELLSSHGFDHNQLTLWKYPSMVRLTELYGHTSRVLHMTQSPDGYTVASAAADETLRFWNVFGSPESTKATGETKSQPFADFPGIR